jgi:hypothetical protein
MEQSVYTIPEYCAAEKISRSRLYDEWKRGEGVEFFRRGAKILISHEARVRHRERLERQAREERARAEQVQTSSKRMVEDA